MDYSIAESLKFKGNKTKLGAKTSSCLELSQLFEASMRGFRPDQSVHLAQCPDCVNAYVSYLRLRRAEARDKLKLSMRGVPLPDMSKLR